VIAARHDDILVRLGTPRDLPAVRELYREWSYRGKAQPEDTLVVAEHDSRIVGVVRMTLEHGFVMLRGMRVQPEFQRTGVGTRMLRLFEEQLGDRECHCIPFDHLLDFYGQIGFRKLAPKDAPAFLVERVEAYRAEGQKVAIMRRPA